MDKSAETLLYDKFTLCVDTNEFHYFKVVKEIYTSSFSTLEKC